MSHVPRGKKKKKKPPANEITESLTYATGVPRGSGSVTTTFKALSHTFQASVVKKNGQNRGKAMCNRPKRD